MKLNTILDQIDLGSMALPEFQRGYVWNRNQVKGLFDSLYHGHPVGSLLVWITNVENADVKGDIELPPGTVRLLLDGQQRITSLYGIVRGKPPKFFQGNEKSFTGLYFNLEDEIFEFYAPVKMKDNPYWIDATDLMQRGLGKLLPELTQVEEIQHDLNKYINRLNAIENIKNTDFHIEEVTGDDKTVETVVDIFNRVNSGGTKLSKGDLALAKICAAWPDARNEMNKKINKWHESGYPNFKIDWLLRCVNTIVTGEARFIALKDISAEAFQDGLQKAEKYIDKTLNLIAARLGLDNSWVLGSPYSIPLIVRYIHDRNGSFGDHKKRDQLLFWYTHTFLWGRYAGSTESILDKDLAAIEDKENSLNNLIENLRRDRGDLSVNSSDFKGWSRGARFYSLLYMLTRVYHAKDWDTGIELASHTLGHQADLQLHHIFPKALLYRHEYEKSEVNALANFTFLTQETNVRVSDKNPEDYLTEFEEKNPGLIASHWIPMDRDLWKVENYLGFLEARRELLAKAANDFLQELVTGAIPDVEIAKTIGDRGKRVYSGSISDEEEEKLLLETNNWIQENGLPEGEIEYQLTDDEGNELALFDLAWPSGLQEGLSTPVALLINEGFDTLITANSAGYLYFTDADSFKHYVQTEILAD
jgi:hypothetical protein